MQDRSLGLDAYLLGVWRVVEGYGIGGKKSPLLTMIKILQRGLISALQLVLRYLNCLSNMCDASIEVLNVDLNVPMKIDPLVQRLAREPHVVLCIGVCGSSDVCLYVIRHVSNFFQC